jgi:glycosyltransferase involved in cell wall biosynthesis
MQKNILYIYHNADAYGGGDESLLALLSRLDRNRFNPSVLCTSGGLFADRLKELGIEFKIIDKEFLERIRRLRLLFLLIRLCIFVIRQKIKLIHINSLGRLHYLTLLCKLMGIRSVYHLRSLLTTRGIGGRTRFIINLSDKIIVHCEHMKKTAIAAGLNKDKVCVIYNGVDLGKFNPNISGNKFRKELGVNSNTNLVGMAGRIVPWKGCGDFIKAASEVIKVIADTKFIIVGEAPEEQYLGQLIKLSEDLNIKDRIIFAGLRSDMPQVYAALNLFVLPSWEEPWGRVTAEAMAMKKPVIATNAGGLPEIITQDISGILIPPRDSATLANTIISVLKDSKKRETIIENGFQTINRYYNIARHVKNIEGVYDNLLNLQ